MKATITKYGVLEITAENSLEEYALDKFYGEAVINVEDIQRNESEYLRGSKVLFYSGVED